MLYSYIAYTEKHIISYGNLLGSSLQACFWSAVLIRGSCWVGLKNSESIDLHGPRAWNIQADAEKQAALSQIFRLYTAPRRGCRSAGCTSIMQLVSMDSLQSGGWARHTDRRSRFGEFFSSDSRREKPSLEPLEEAAGEKRGRQFQGTKKREKEKMTQLQTKKVFKRRAKRGRSEADSRGKAGPLCSFLWAGTSGERERGSDKPSEFIDRFPSNPVSILPEWQVSGWELKPWIIHKITKPFSTLQPLNLMINFHQNLARRSSRISQVSTTQQSTHLPSMGKTPFACDKICKYAYMQICMCKCRMPGKTYTYI